MIERGRCPSSLLFTGPEGAGKGLAAIRFATELNCRSGCGKNGPFCPSCVKASKFEHPDLHVVFPLPYGSIEKSLPALMESRRKNFFNQGEFGSRARSIGIDLIRNVIEQAHKHPFEGVRTVIIVFEAHMATAEAQNAFLKLLEEPPEPVVIILVTEFPDRLLPTITSRCFNVRFDYLSPEAVKRFLEAVGGIAPEEAGRVALISDGNLRRALMAGDERFSAVERAAAEAVRALLDGRERPIVMMGEALARDFDREELGSVLEESARIMRLIWRGGEKGSESGVVGALGEKIGGGAVERAAGRNFPLDLRRISCAAKALKGNADPELTLTQLFLDLADKWY